MFLSAALNERIYIMADSKTKKSTTAKTAGAPARKTAEAKEVPAKQPEVPIVAKEIDPEQYVTVRNGFQGRLIYKSPKTGERYVWSEFGDGQEMQLRELRQAKSSAKKFFENNWFMFDDEWIPEYLGVQRFYKNAVSIDRFDDLFGKPADEVEKIVSAMSGGQKRSVAYRARTLINEGAIDSRKVIATLEKSLGTKLIED